MPDPDVLAWAAREHRTLPTFDKDFGELARGSALPRTCAGTLVVASAGADAQAQQVISQRDRTDKGVVFLWTGSRDAKPGLAQLKHARNGAGDRGVSYS